MNSSHFHIEQILELRITSKISYPVCCPFGLNLKFSLTMLRLNLTLIFVFIVTAEFTCAYFPLNRPRPPPPPVKPKPPAPTSSSYTSFQPGPLCKSLGDIKSPKKEKEVRDIVLNAISTKKTVKAFGSRHSVADIICTDGIAIDMSSYKGMKLNKDKSATVLAGNTLQEVGEFLFKNKLALRATPAYGGITVGGALGTGAHGTSLKHETSLSGQTKSVKIIDGKGNIRIIQGKQELNAYRLHLGLLGIILEVTFVTVPLFKIKLHNYEVSDNILMNGQWERLARSSDLITMYWFPSVSKVVISNGTFVPVNTPGDAISNANVPPTTDQFNSYSVPVIELLQTLNSVSGMSIMERLFQKSLTALVPDIAPIYTENGRTIKNPAVGFPHKMTVSVCGKNCPWLHGPNNVSYIDNELGLNLKEMAPIVKTIKDILSKSPAAFPFQGFYIRFSKASDLLMSTAYKTDTIHLEFFPVKRKNPYQDPITGMAAYQAMMQTLVFKYGGRTHWGKSGMFYHTRQMIQRKLFRKSMAEFVQQMKKVDPNGIFMNNFAKRLLNLSDKIDTDPRTAVHCALLDTCICRFHKDCGNFQSCGDIKGYPGVKVCRREGVVKLIPDVIGIFGRIFNNNMDFFLKLLSFFPNARG